MKSIFNKPTPPARGTTYIVTAACDSVLPLLICHANGTKDYSDSNKDKFAAPGEISRDTPVRTTPWIPGQSNPIWKWTFDDRIASWDWAYLIGGKLETITPANPPAPSHSLT